jgi:cytidine deaminase
VAIFYANSKYPKVPVKAIAITAFKESEFLPEPVSPCGACRQVLLEAEMRFDTPIKIILASSKKIFVIENAKALLPISFDKSQL